MGFDTVAFVFGGVLLLVGIIGGGFEVRELKIPRVGWAPRLFATLAGLLFLCIGVSVQSTAAAGRGAPASPTIAQAGVVATPAPIDFTIYDQRGENQVSEQVTVLIDGRMVGNLSVNEQYSNASLTVTVPRPGRYSYTVESAAVFNVEGYRRELRGAGQGMIAVDSGKQYDLAGTLTGNTWLVSLVEKR
jgi:hypothetical protein